MNRITPMSLIAASLVTLFGAAVAAPIDVQSPPVVDQREAHQEQRIGQGVTDGAVSAREAYRLERQQGRIDAAAAADSADANLSAGERARLNRMQDQASRDIWQQKHDTPTAGTLMAPAAPPTSGALVDRRESLQDARIRQGIATGQLNARETLQLEREQSRIEATEARAEADGHVSGAERARLENMQNRASTEIWHDKHNHQRAR